MVEERAATARTLINHALLRRQSDGQVSNPKKTSISIPKNSWLQNAQLETSKFSSKFSIF
jgi:hypothetical protein